MVRVYSQPGQLGTTTLGGVYGGHNQYKVTLSPWHHSQFCV